MIQPPSEEQLADLWWYALSEGEREMWLDELPDGAPPGSAAAKLACWRLYWSRGPQLQGEDLDRVSRGLCPVCRRRGFVLGPIGGMSINIECAQLDCRMRFNVALYSGEAVAGHHLGYAAMGPSWPSEPVGVRPDPEDDYADRAEWKSRL